MLKRFDINIVSNPVCDRIADNLEVKDFQYYDKDGFELNQAEQKFYRAMGYPIELGILNHCCWQEPWFELENKKSNLILDHCLLLHRCSYSQKALEQLKELANTIPEANWLINTPQKWGYDFALDAISPDGKIFEVLHIEYDSKDFDIFRNNLISMEYTIRHIDWVDSAKRIWENRDQWQSLKSFAQNDWKSKYIIGWKKSEYTEKSLT